MADWFIATKGVKVGTAPVCGRRSLRRFHPLARRWPVSVLPIILPKDVKKEPQPRNWIVNDCISPLNWYFCLKDLRSVAYLQHRTKANVMMMLGLNQTFKSLN